jgi:hypothetical protein
MARSDFLTEQDLVQPTAAPAGYLPSQADDK